MKKLAKILPLTPVLVFVSCVLPAAAEGSENGVVVNQELERWDDWKKKVAEAIKANLNERKGSINWNDSNVEDSSCVVNFVVVKDRMIKCPQLVPGTNAPFDACAKQAITFLDQNPVLLFPTQNGGEQFAFCKAEFNTKSGLTNLKVVPMSTVGGTSRRKARKDPATFYAELIGPSLRHEPTMLERLNKLKKDGYLVKPAPSPPRSGSINDLYAPQAPKN